MLTLERDSATAALLAMDTEQLMRPLEELPSGVLRILRERARSGSRPGARTDDHVICLAIEGGGMRGAVSAGMCVVLEAAGLVQAFDRIYGVSAGALNGAAVAAGQASFSATHYQDAATRRVINPLRPLRGRPVIDLDFLFGDLIARRKPLSFERLAGGPELRALAAAPDDSSLRVLGDFRDIGELMQAVRASASLPALGGAPAIFRGERLVDGGLIEPVPFETAVREGATHVLVLRSRPAAYRKAARVECIERIVLHGSAGLRSLLKDRVSLYNRQAAALERLSHDSAGALHQVVVPDGARLVRRLQTSEERIVAALRLGASAMARDLFTDAIDLCWQPITYRTAMLDRHPAQAPRPHERRWRPRPRTADASN